MIRSHLHNTVCVHVCVQGHREDDYQRVVDGQFRVVKLSFFKKTSFISLYLVIVSIECGLFVEFLL